MNVPLDRDVADKATMLFDEDDGPVDVPNQFKAAIRKAVSIAENACESLLEEENPKRSAVEFWCDTMTTLRRVETDISIVIDRNLGGSK